MASSVIGDLYDWPKKRLLLCYDESERPEEGSLIARSWSGTIQIGHKEAVGVAFHTKILQQNGLYVYPDESDSGASSPTASKSGTASRGMSHANSTASLGDSDQPPPGVSWKGSKKKKGKKKEGQDLYALLGLTNERWMATENQLKNAYRRTCLEHHPDKKLAGVTDDAEKVRVEEYFKQIQEAYAVLSDPTKRREYDSTDVFDDTLPLECAPADFHKVFAPAFRRNARWSTAQPVPDPGDETTPWEEVEKFYNFWFTFKSWREFPHPDEEDAEGAESREHRRWIDRNNSKLREKGKKEEGRRLREFVDAAYKLDPRVVAKKEEERAERERKKAEKEEARRKLEEEEAAKKAAEEAAKKAAEEAAKKAAEEAKRQREAAKKAAKDLRKRLRAVCEGGDGIDRLASEDDVDKLATSLEPEKLQVLIDNLYVFGISREQQQELVMNALSQFMSAQQAEAAAKEKQRREAELALKNIAKKEHAEKMKAMREWNDEELRMLDKAVAKFPQGTPKRWEAVAAYIRTRTLDEVLLMVKERQGMSASRMKAQEDFRSGIKKKAEVQAQADLRLNAFSDVNVSLAGAAAATLLAAATPAASSTIANGSTASTATAAGVSTPAAAAAKPSATPQSSTAATAAAGVSRTSSVTSMTGSEASAASAAAAAAKKKVVSADTGEWSEEQEVALVKALKQFGKELGAERWEKVSSVVPGKTKAQCFKRFKELREVFRNKKGGAGGEDGDE